MLMPNAASAADLHAPARPRLRAHRSPRHARRAPKPSPTRTSTCSAGHADIVIAGGAESVIHPLHARRLRRRCRRCRKRNDSPETASRPYDVDRDGFVMGEGAACLVLETEEHAMARGAKIYAELVGGGVTGDSYHITAPDPEGLGASRARARGARAGRRDARRRHPHQRARDVAPRPATSPSTTRCCASSATGCTRSPSRRRRRATGHLLGGTGALEAIFTILAMHERHGTADDQPHRRRTPRSRSTSRARPSPSAMDPSSRSATRSASAGTTPSRRSARV